MPPNNQGNATPFYNQDDNGENPAKDGVATFDELDRYTKQSIANLDRGYVAFAGQRDDGFYADIQAVFDLLKLRIPGKDSQGGFNLHLMALAIPIDELGGDKQMAGVYATTSRQAVQDSADGLPSSEPFGDWVQVARQGNPLFNEGLVALEDKDLYSRTTPGATRCSSGSTPRDPSWPSSSISSCSSRTCPASRPAAPTSRASSSPM